MLEWVAVGITLVAYGLGAVIWGVRQEGKISLQEAKIAGLKELINARFDSIDKRLDRIEVVLNGNLHIG